MATSLSISARRDLARRVALLEDLPDPLLDELLERCELVRLAPGEVLFRAGEPARGLGLIATGEVALHLRVRDDEHRLVGRLRAGEAVGELSVIDARPPASTATATTEVQLFRLPCDALTELLADRRPAARILLRRLSAVVTRRLRLLDHQLQRARRGSSDTTLPPTGARRLEALGPQQRQRAGQQRHLRQLSEAAVAPLLDVMRFSEVPSGGVLFHEGSPAWACYLVLHGSIEVLVRRPAQLQELAHAPAGSLLSPLAILDVAVHAATCRAHEPSRVVELRRPAFEALLDDGEDGAWSLMLALLRVLAGQLREGMRHTLYGEWTGARGPPHERDDFLVRAQAGLGDFDLQELVLVDRRA